MESAATEMIKESFSHSEIIISGNWEPQVFKPSFILCKDSQKNAIVLAISGTKYISDWITDGIGDPQQSETGEFHPGMETAAKFILDLVKDDICRELKQNPHFRMIVTGHSLGAGVAGIAVVK